MKALIINRSQPDREQLDAQRFQRMQASLAAAGIEAPYHPIQTIKALTGILEKEQPDLVYCANYYLDDHQGARINVHKYLDSLGVHRVGSAPDALELVISKTDLKKRWVKDRIATPRFFTMQPANGNISGLELAVKARDYPYILKPNREGNSRGLDRNSVVFDEGHLRQKADTLLQKYGALLVEKFWAGARDFREYTIAMIGNGKGKLLMPAEIRLKTKQSIRIVTTRDKDGHRAQAFPLKNTLFARRLIRFASKALESAGMRDYARLDVIRAHGKFYAIEINGLPMIPDKWFEVCASGSGLDGDQYLNAIFLSAILRTHTQGAGRSKALPIPKLLRAHIPQPIFTRLTGSSNA